MPTHLVTITPLEVLGAEVLVGILGALWQRRKVAPVLPVVSPQPVRVGSSNHKGRDNAALILSALYSLIQTDPAAFSLIRRQKRHGNSQSRTGGGHTKEKSSSRDLKVRLAAGPRRNGN